MAQILPNIWLGNEKVANHKEFIKKKNIKFIVNCEKDLFFLDNANTLNNNYDLDIIIKKLYQYWIDICKSIYENICEKNSVLIYCSDLDQKSPSVIMAYVLIYGNMELNNGITALQNKFDSKYFPNELISKALKYLKDN